MTCSKPFSIVVDPGVPFQNLLWSVVYVNTGNGTASFSPDGSASNVVTGVARSFLGAGNNQGRFNATGILNYVGPNRACRFSTQIVNNDDGNAGVTTYTCAFFLNAIFQSQVVMPLGFNGTLNLNFTAVTGAIQFQLQGVSVQSNQFVGPNPLQLDIVGTALNL